MGSIRREINEDNGIFLYKDTSTVKGIIRTIDNLRIMVILMMAPIIIMKIAGGSLRHCKKGNVECGGTQLRK
jgi:hypothetical protein